MRFKHRGVEYELPDEWWREAGMPSTNLPVRSFQSGPSPLAELAVFYVAVDDIEPVQRKGSHGVFNDNVEFGTAHDRVLRILRGFVDRSPIPPIEVARNASNADPRFKLIHGAHRLYCAVAAGHTHVPAVEVVDFWGTYPGSSNGSEA